MLDRSQTQYILTDLDGTLLRSDRSVSAFTVDVFSRLLEAGHVVSFATARSTVSALPLIQAIPWRHPAVIYNGAMVVEAGSWKAAGGFQLDADIVNAILAHSLAAGLPPLLFAIDGGGVERILHLPITRESDRLFHAARPGDPRFMQIDAMVCPVGWHVLNIMHTGERDALAGLLETVQTRFDLTCHLTLDPYLQGAHILELSHVLAHKGEGAKAWAERVGCRPGQIIAFGDNLNDLGLFDTAGTRVAMANAVPELKARADHVTDGNDEDGVARWLAAHLL